MIVTGSMKDLNKPGGTHTMLVVGQRGDDYVVNDPGLFYKLPGTIIRGADLEHFFKLGIAIGT